MEYQTYKDTYFYFIIETLRTAKLLIKDTSDWKSFNPNPYNPYDRSRMVQFNIARARHIQSITLMGIVAEHLLKFILLKHAINIQEPCSHHLITFRQAIECFRTQICPRNNNYFKGIKPFKLLYRDKYLGYSTIKGDNYLDIFIKMRNNYIHFASPLEERRPIVWNLYNFLCWLIKKELQEEISSNKDYISDEDVKFIGNEEVLQLWSLGVKPKNKKLKPRKILT